MPWDNQFVLGLAAAFGAGLLIGIERKRRKGQGAQRALAGIRTFTLAALMGAIAQSLNQPWLVGLGGGVAAGALRTTMIGAACELRA